MFLELVQIYLYTQQGRSSHDKLVQFKLYNQSIRMYMKSL